jgi:hypothetical protein
MPNPILKISPTASRSAPAILDGGAIADGGGLPNGPGGGLKRPGGGVSPTNPGDGVGPIAKKKLRANAWACGQAALNSWAPLGGPRGKWRGRDQGASADGADQQSSQRRLADDT